MAAFNKFNSFTYQLGLKTMDLDADVLRVYLTNAAPVATNTAYNTPAEIAAGNGYTAGGIDAVGIWIESPAGTGQLACTDITWTAAGGAIGPFRYAVLYDNTSVIKHLIGWWDYGSSLTLLAGETFTVDFGANALTVT